MAKFLVILAVAMSLCDASPVDHRRSNNRCDRFAVPGFCNAFIACGVCYLCPSLRQHFNQTTQQCEPSLLDQTTDCWQWMDPSQTHCPVYDVMVPRYPRKRSVVWPGDPIWPGDPTWPGLPVWPEDPDDPKIRDPEGPEGPGGDPIWPLDLKQPAHPNRPTETPLLTNPPRPIDLQAPTDLSTREEPPSTWPFTLPHRPHDPQRPANPPMATRIPPWATALPKISDGPWRRMAMDIQ